MAQQPAGTIFYNAYDFSSGQPQLRLASMRPDGTAATLLPVALPEPVYPAASADGRQVAVTAADPKKLFTMSRDVFVLDLATGQLLQLTSFPNVFGSATTNFSDKTVHWDAAKFTAPYFKAFSPDAKHLAVSAYEVSGAFVTSDESALWALWTDTTTTPTLRVYAFDGSPDVLVAAGTGADIHCGDGIDWSPNGNLLAWPNTIDVIYAGGGFPGPVTAIFLMEPVADARTTGQARQMTFPGGETGYVVGGAYTAWETDYQPAFSPDGKRLAYIHSVSEVVGYLPGYASQPSLRILDVNGTNDVEVLRFNVGDYVTHLSWSPDGSQLLFDLGPQAIGPESFPYLEAVPSSDFLYIVNTNGSGFRQLVNVPSTWPAWSALAVTPNVPPRLTIGRSANPGQLSLAWPVGLNFTLQSSPQVGPGAVWQRVVSQPVTNGATQVVNVNTGSGTLFYRLRSP